MEAFDKISRMAAPLMEITKEEIQQSRDFIREDYQGLMQQYKGSKDTLNKLMVLNIVCLDKLEELIASLEETEKVFFRLKMEP